MAYRTARSIAESTLRNELKRRSWTADEIDAHVKLCEAMFAELDDTPTEHEVNYDPRDVHAVVHKAPASI